MRTRAPLVLSIAALVVAVLGWTDIAESTIDRLITGADIRDGSVTGTDIRNNSLTGADIRNNSLTGADMSNEIARVYASRGLLGPGSLFRPLLDKPGFASVTVSCLAGSDPVRNSLRLEVRRGSTLPLVVWVDSQVVSTSFPNSLGSAQPTGSLLKIDDGSRRPVSLAGPSPGTGGDRPHLSFSIVRIAQTARLFITRGTVVREMTLFINALGDESGCEYSLQVFASL